MTGIRAITKSVDSELLLQNARWGPPKNGEFSKSWLMLQQAGVSGLCEKFHLYRLEKLVAISKFLDSYCSKFMGGGQDNPAGLTSPPGGQDKPAGICCPPGVKVTRVGGRISRDRLPPGGQANHGWLAPRGATCPGGKINWDTGT